LVCWVLFGFAALCSGQSCFVSTANWADVLQVSKTITTLQVVANPVLNPLTSPVAKQAWKSLADLKADLVRYVPWFPYPKVGVAELNPPKNGKTSWDFTDIRPQLEAFMTATAGRPTIPNFSTQPTWMYNTNDWSYPSDPNDVSWNYPRGNAYPNTTDLVSKYYGRLISWLTKGSFTDEYGVVHTGGYHYPLSHWEVFNEPEGCHGLNYVDYTKQFDAVVKEVRAVADPEKKIKFVGLALGGREMDWITYFLTPSNHDPSVLPIEYISFHFYASCSNRTDPNAYEQFFPSADGFLGEAQQILATKNKLTPTTKLDVDEMGVILPNDNDPNAPVPPPRYWNAAGSMYAYLFGNMAVMGYDVLGQSQLAGSPPIPKWDIPDAQFPSVSLLNWTTGVGNARYWVLKLLLDHFQAGDKFVSTTVHLDPSSPICAVVDGHAGYGMLSIECADPKATINDIQFAAFGTPTGICGHYSHDPKCDATNATAYVKQKCLGMNRCSILSYPTFGDPCYGTYKRFIVQATCTGTAGGFGIPPASGTVSPYVQAVSTTTGNKALVVNKTNKPSCVILPSPPSEVLSKSGQAVVAHAYIVDEQTGDGPARTENFKFLPIHVVSFCYCCC